MLAMLEMVKTYPTFDVSLSWKGQNTRRENSVLSNPKIRQDYTVFENDCKKSQDCERSELRLFSKEYFLFTFY